jgi:uncharacterized SAM-binding protein YcdF (DUF218 family)
LKRSRFLRWLGMYALVIASTALVFLALTKPSEYEYLQPYQLAIVFIFVFGGAALMAESLLRTIDRIMSRGEK